MNAALAKNLFFVREHVGMFKAANNFDILDPANGQEVLHCREDRLGFFTRILRFTSYKRMTPFNIEIRIPDGERLLTIKRGVSLFLSKVHVLDHQDQRVGGFKQKLFTIGGAFRVLGPDDEELCELKGKWTSWSFSFRKGEHELAKVAKKWSGIGKELFTSTDNYILEISDQVPTDNPLRYLILAAVMCIDMVLKE
jgi:uncharacterized protein YxjI